MKLLYLGNMYNLEYSFASEWIGRGHQFFPVVEDSYWNVSCFYNNCNPFKNVVPFFGAVSLAEVSQNSVDSIISNVKPDIILVRCWNSFSNLNLPNAIFYKVESPARDKKDDPLPLIMPHRSNKAFLTMVKQEIDAYRRLLPIPVGYFPYGVSSFYEKPSNKKYDIMSTGTAILGYKLQSYEMLVKPICDTIPNALHVYQNYGRDLMPWAKNCFKDPFFAEQGPGIIGLYKIYVCPVAMRFDHGMASHKLFQSLGCRTFTITQHVDGIEDMFGRDGENLCYADSSKECLDKVQFYLKHDTEREKIADRGYKFVHATYNWFNLFKNALLEVGDMYGTSL